MTDKFSPIEVTPSLSEVIRRYVEQRLCQVHTAIPGEVVDYDAGTRLATVQPTIKALYESAGPIARPPIPNVRVVMPGGNGMEVSLPLAAGDTGLIVFCERSLDEWMTQGGNVTPETTRKHDLMDAVFFPGLAHDRNVPSGGSATDLVVRATDNSVYVKITAAGEVQIKGSAVRLGNPSATAALALATLTNAQLTALSAAFTSWLGAGPIDTILAGFITTLQGTGWPFDVSASKAFGE